MKKMNKKAQEDFGGLPMLGKVLLVIAVTLVVLIFLAKVGEWLGLWKLSWI